MLELRNLTIQLDREDRYLVKDLTLSLAAGEKAVLMGEEGNGKSTLLKAILHQAGWCTVTGDIRLEGPVGYLPQFPAVEGTLAALFGSLPVWDHVEVLASLGIEYDSLFSTQLFSTLSGGEKVRYFLLSLLMQDPDILLLDEPGNDLDIDTLEWLEQFLVLCPQTVLFVSHDETLVERVHPTILHLEQLHRKSIPRLTRSSLSWPDYIRQRQQSMDHQDQVAAGQRRDHEAKMARWRRIHDAIEHRQNTATRQDPRKAAALKRKLKSVNAAGRRYEKERASFQDFSDSEEAILTHFDPAIQVPARKIILEWEGSVTAAGHVLCRQAALSVRGPGILGITGRNGAGKSTLLRTLHALLKDRADLKTGYMPQNYVEVLDLSMSAAGFLKDWPEARTRLGSMRFTSREMEVPMGELSGGQQAKILFLSMVLADCDVLLLDEPTRNFSPLSTPVIREALRAFGGRIILVSHDRKLLQICDEVLELTPAGLLPDARFESA
ncbi:ATP-binding cassette domain-containing protein [Faecalibaculum rodentium]|uniref:ATP-binding cassette domain-containing protein n=1 Tax=Faecalibaculum rodentium TaxID=1702221 RepID=UPI0023F1C557|nr:ATP-binding cassette domain-containing protein [Faecalibaculum rodentium]